MSDQKYSTLSCLLRSVKVSAHNLRNPYIIYYPFLFLITMTPRSLPLSLSLYFYLSLSTRFCSTCSSSTPLKAHTVIRCKFELIPRLPSRSCCLTLLTPFLYTLANSSFCPLFHLSPDLSSFPSPLPKLKANLPWYSDLSKKCVSFYCFLLQFPLMISCILLMNSIHSH